MSLLELCEPLFQYVCLLNRAGRKSGHYEYAAVRAEVLSLFEQMHTRAISDPRVSHQYKALELTLLFFTDSMISESGHSFASKWNSSRLADERSELAGDEKFYDHLEATMADQSTEASERLAVFATMIGLGFTGWYHGQPEYLRKKMLEITPRIRPFMEADVTGKLCPESYENVDTRDLVEPPSRSIAFIAIAFVVFCITTLGCNYYLFDKTTKHLIASLKEVVKHEAEFSQPAN